jgi:hypothetical protein
VNSGSSTQRQLPSRDRSILSDDPLNLASVAIVRQFDDEQKAKSALSRFITFENVHRDLSGHAFSVSGQIRTPAFFPASHS